LKIGVARFEIYIIENRSSSLRPEARFENFRHEFTRIYIIENRSKKNKKSFRRLFAKYFEQLT